MPICHHARRGTNRVLDVILVILGIGAAAGLLTWGATVRWPNHDPAAPRLDRSSPVLHHGTGRRTRLRAVWRTRMDPQVATGLALTLGVAALVVLTVAAGLLLLMVRSEAGLARFDLSFARWAADHATPASTTMLRWISAFGGTAGVLGLAVVVGVVEHRRLPNRSIPAFLALTILGQFAVTNLIKIIVDRARPALDQLTGFSSTSFPSGHAAAAAAGLAAIALLLGRRRSRRARAAVAGGAVAIAVMVAGTRVGLGVHWFTDVLAGLAIGWAWFALWSIAFGGRLLHFGAPGALADDLAAEASWPRHP